MITAKPNQSILDLIIMSTGSVEAGMAWCLANNVAISSVPTVGTEFAVPDDVVAAGDAAALRYIVENRVQIGTANVSVPPSPPPILTMGILLYPDMKFVPDGSFDPYATGYYQFFMRFGDNWSNRNDLVSDYLNTNAVQYAKLNSYTGSGTYPIGTQASVTPMPDRNIPYQIPAAVPGDIMMVWWVQDGTDCMLFEDILGNRAVSKPLLLLKKTSNTQIATILPQIDITVVEATEDSVTLSLFGSAPTSVAGVDLSIDSMTWFGDLLGAIEDPAHPGDIRYRLITIDVADVYVFGLNVFYMNNTTGRVLPSCSISVAIEIA
jgi:hypothetical protein